MAGYTLEGAKWATTQITWSFATTTYDVDALTPFSAAISGAYQAAVTWALQQWSSVAPLAFTQVADSSTYENAADIRIGFGLFSTATTRVVGQTNLRWDAKGNLVPDEIVRLEDPGQYPLVPGSGGTYTYAGTATTLQQIALHEIGHALGLGHSTDPNAVMYPSVGINDRTLDQNDISGIQSLYGVYPPTLGYVDKTTNQTGTITMDASAPGAPGFVQHQYIYAGSDDMLLSTVAPNVFIHSGAGVDAIQVSNGQNVLDGGLGSNFLTGGTGIDTFFTDARAPGAVWNTIRNFHAGDAATLWGFVPGTSSYRWETSIAGAAGEEGATLRANIVGGGGRVGNGIDASITFTGLSVAQAKGLQIVTGVQPAGSYLYVYNPGV